MGFLTWALRGIAFTVAVSPLATCEAATNSGFYMNKAANSVQLIQLIEDSAHHITGRSEIYVADERGKILINVMTLEGMADAADISLMFKPVNFVNAGITASVHRDGPVLTVMARGTTTLFKKTDLNAYRAAQHDVWTNAAATHARVADAKPTPLPAYSPPPSASHLVASFDCAKAGSAAEHLICQSDKLANLDAAMSEQYRRVLRYEKPEQSEKTRAEQRTWLGQRNNCATEGCLLERYIARLTSLGKEGAELLNRIPTQIHRVGDCELTTIDELSYRFAGDPTSGSAVEYANGGTGVSYDTVPAIAASHVGDKVKVCLVSVPQNCPAGDNRGRVYSAANTRTAGHWVLADSQHGCGV